MKGHAYSQQNHTVVKNNIPLIQFVLLVRYLIDYVYLLKKCILLLNKLFFEITIFDNALFLIQKEPFFQCFAYRTTCLMKDIRAKSQGTAKIND